jgi:hypothetical protein
MRCSLCFGKDHELEGCRGFQNFLVMYYSGLLVTDEERSSQRPPPGSGIARQLDVIFTRQNRNVPDRFPEFNGDITSFCYRYAIRSLHRYSQDFIKHLCIGHRDWDTTIVLYHEPARSYMFRNFEFLGDEYRFKLYSHFYLRPVPGGVESLL